MLGNGFAQVIEKPIDIRDGAISASAIDVYFDPESRILSFTENGQSYTGVVFDRNKDGSINIWNVEAGKATHRTMYYANGQIERELEMSEGREHGQFVMYYSNGKRYVEQYYDHGTPIKTWKRWNEGGELIETIEH